MKSYLLFFMVFVTINLAQTKLVVSVNESGDFQDIQSAINSANDKDTIFVKNGIYDYFILENKELKIIGESKDSTIINGKGWSILFNTPKDCEIQNIRFRHSAIAVKNYELYKIYQKVPKLFINNCYFEVHPKYPGEGRGIWIYVNFEDFAATELVDTLANSIGIFNCTFEEKGEAIVFELGGILGKKSLHKFSVNNEDSLKLLNIDCSYNYFELTDSSSIASKIKDNTTHYDPNMPDWYNFSSFNFIPWSASLNKFSSVNSSTGIRYNNFLNCGKFFVSSLYYPKYLDIKDILEIPITFYLENAFPNPFNPSTSFYINLPNNEIVSLNVVNSVGEEISSLKSKQELMAGRNKIDLNFNNQPSGVYFINVRAKNISKIIKVVLIK
ncbi:MAG: T9SS type A sorting domain-containing protein [Rhodothermaceae bacterium]